MSHGTALVSTSHCRSSSALLPPYESIERKFMIANAIMHQAIHRYPTEGDGVALMETPAMRKRGIISVLWSGVVQ